MKIKGILFLLIILASVNLSAQQKWTLRQCVDYAVENNIEIKQQELKVEGAEISLNTSKMSRLPDLNASVGPGFGFGRNPINLPTGDGKFTTVYESMTTFNSSFGASSSTPVFTGFRIPNEIKKRELDLMSATANLDKARDDMSLQIASLYLEVLFKKEIVKAYNDQLILTNRQLGKTKDLVEAGKVPRSQEYDMIAQQAKDELNMTTAQNDLELGLLNLSQALNLTANANFDIIEPNVDNEQIVKSTAKIVSTTDIYNIALGIKPQMKVAEYDLDSKKKSLDIAKSGYYPTIDFNMSYNTSYNNKNGGFNYQFRNEGREYIGLSVKIPIFNRFATRNSVRQARLDIENQQFVLDNVKLVLFKEIQQAHQSATAAQAKYTSSEKALTAAEIAYRYAEDRYDVGKSSVFEFIEAQTKLLTSRSEQIQAKYDFLFRTKILDFYRGESIDIN